ncbi:MAG: STAS domain-containing protein [Candidatus Rokuibacteriota bacterium]
MNATETSVDEDVQSERPGDRERAGLTRLCLLGPITAATAPRVRDVIRGYAERGCDRLLLDLERVTAVDAVGVAALLSGQKLIDARPGGALVLRLNAEVRRALRDSGTIAVFRIVDARE